MTKAFLDPRHPRLLCECCELPTRAVATIPPAIPDYKSTSTSCPLCEWENAPVDRHGETVSDSSAAAAERNGGHTLAEAQSNFRRFLSMYDPSHLEPWMPEPPTAEEQKWKEELVRLYKRILDPYAVDGRESLTQILQLESALAEAEQSRVDDAEVSIDMSGDDDSDNVVDPTYGSRGELGIRYFTHTGEQAGVWPPIPARDDGADSTPPAK
jgi:hypothetical protein